METNFFRLANAGAMRQGVFFGLWWVMGFACVIGSFSAPLLALLTFFFFVSTPVLGGVLAVRFSRDSGRTDLSVGRLYLYGVLLYFYASIWLAVAVYVYFAFMDDGFFFGCYPGLPAPSGGSGTAVDTGLAVRAFATDGREKHRDAHRRHGGYGPDCVLGQRHQHQPDGRFGAGVAHGVGGAAHSSDQVKTNPKIWIFQ